jgi:hypothetical protein
MDAPNADARPVFSDAEWAALKSMCGAPPGPAVAPAGAGKLKNG